MHRANRKLKPKYVQVYLTEEEFDSLADRAASAGLSRTEYMRRLLIEDGGQFRNQRDAVFPTAKVA